MVPPPPEMIPVLIDTAKELKGPRRRLFMAKAVRAMGYTTRRSGSTAVTRRRGGRTATSQDRPILSKLSRDPTYQRS